MLLYTESELQPQTGPRESQSSQMQVGLGGGLLKEKIAFQPHPPISLEARTWIRLPHPILTQNTLSFPGKVRSWPGSSAPSPHTHLLPALPPALPPTFFSSISSPSWAF